MINNNHEKILNYIELIQRHPKDSVKFFYFDDGKKFIVDGNMLKLLPWGYYNLYGKDEFYIHVNPIEKKVMYYAFDIEELSSGKHIHEEEGFFEWEQVEDCIYNFFVLNIKTLSSVGTPYIDVQDPKASGKSSSTNYSNPGNYNSGYQNYQNNYEKTFGYGSSAYKDREAFYDKLKASIKENSTTKAIDLINCHMDQMIADKKFDELDTVIRLIDFDKLNVSIMLGILDITKQADGSLKERRFFFDKVKTHLTKLKPTRTNTLLRDREPKTKVV
jgi:hypothetical protein